MKHAKINIIRVRINRFAISENKTWFCLKPNFYFSGTILFHFINRKYWQRRFWLYQSAKIFFQSWPNLFYIQISDKIETPLYMPKFRPVHWQDSLAYLRYGLGNFYSIDSTVTHYHNWLDRIDKDIDEGSTQTIMPNGEGVPVAYVRAYTENFLRDYTQGRLVVPRVS